MLGAQARAAELHAMRAAAQRQKAHDGDGVPETQSACLTDFARPLQNRNKGLKAYKTFSFADLEQERIRDDNTTKTFEDIDYPAEDGRGPAIVRSLSAGPPGCSEQLSLQPFRFPPSAPKAMLSSALKARKLIHDENIPEKIVGLPYTPWNDNAGKSDDLLPISIKAKPISDPRLPVPTTDQGFGANNVQNPLVLPPSEQNFVFGMEGYEPCKIEMKHDRRMALFAEAAVERCEAKSWAAQYDKEQHFDQLAQHKAQPTYLPSSLPYGDWVAASPIAPAEFHGLVQNTSAAYNLLVRNRLCRNAEGDWNYDQGDFRYPKPLPNFGFVRHDLPYSQNTKMQNFAAAQKAMARTGKTVLNNPALRKAIIDTQHHGAVPINSAELQYLNSKLSSLDGTNRYIAEIPEALPSDWTPDLAPRHVKTSMEAIANGIRADRSPNVDCSLGGQKRKTLAECPAILRAIRDRGEKCPPEQGPAVERPVVQSDHAWETLAGSFADIPFPIDDDVGSHEWCELKEPSLKNRKKTRQHLRTVAARMDTEADNIFADTQVAAVGQDAQDWLISASRSKDTRRDMVERIIEEHTRIAEQQNASFGAIGGPVKHSKGYTIDARIVKAVADILITVEQYAEEHARVVQGINMVLDNETSILRKSTGLASKD